MLLMRIINGGADHDEEHACDDDDGDGGDDGDDDDDAYDDDNDRDHQSENDVFPNYFVPALICEPSEHLLTRQTEQLPLPRNE